MKDGQKSNPANPVSKLPIQMCRICARALCGEPIDDKRTVKGASFCSSECKAADKKARRSYRASRHCQTCGRAAGKRRPEETLEGLSSSVAPGAQRS